MTVPAALAVALSGQSEWEHRDTFPPGPQLAVALSSNPHLNVVSDAEDDGAAADAELLAAARAARRQMSWAASRQLAMLAVLSKRRHAEAASWPRPPGYRMLGVDESLIEEISLALGVTSNAAAILLRMAVRLAEDLPQMRGLLEAGLISVEHVRILCDALTGLPPQLIPLLEAAVAPDAPEMTTGQFRKRIKAVLQALDPEGFLERTRTRSQQHRRLEQWDNGNGTADLALCDLPAEQISAIYNKITAVAHAMRADGDPRSLDQLRADLAAALLQGTSLPAAARTVLTTPAETDSGAPQQGAMSTPETTNSDTDSTPGPGTTGLAGPAHPRRLDENADDTKCATASTRTARTSERGTHTTASEPETTTSPDGSEVGSSPGPGTTGLASPMRPQHPDEKANDTERESAATRTARTSDQANTNSASGTHTAAGTPETTSPGDSDVGNTPDPVTTGAIDTAAQAGTAGPASPQRAGEKSDNARHASVSTRVVRAGGASATQSAASTPGTTTSPGGPDVGSTPGPGATKSVGAASSIDETDAADSVGVADAIRAAGAVHPRRPDAKRDDTERGCATPQTVRTSERANTSSASGTHTAASTREANVTSPGGSGGGSAPGSTTTDAIDTAAQASTASPVSPQRADKMSDTKHASVSTRVVRTGGASRTQSAARMAQTATSPGDPNVGSTPGPDTTNAVGTASPALPRSSDGTAYDAKRASGENSTHRTASTPSTATSSTGSGVGNTPGASTMDAIGTGSAVHPRCPGEKAADTERGSVSMRSFRTGGQASTGGGSGTGTAVTSASGAMSSSSCERGVDPVQEVDAQLAGLLARIVDRHLATVLAQARAAGKLDQLASITSRAVQRIDLALAALRDSWCQATGPNATRHGHDGYKPPAAMQRLIEQRHPHCVFPTCNRPADGCDIDHTRPHDKGGLTCRCNLAPLCRRHHRTKQSSGWKLFQLWPGLLIWIAPNGQWHTVTPHPRP